MCKIVYFHGFQRPKFRVHPAPKVHDFAIRCMNFWSHFEHLICHISMVQTFILARRMVFSASNNSLNSDIGFMHNRCPTTNYKNNSCKNCAFPVKIMVDFRI